MNVRPQAIRARRLRRNSTEVEQRLWRALREARLPWRFRRQHPIGGRIVDLACPARKLAIELDGGQHDQQRAAVTLIMQVSGLQCRLMLTKTCNGVFPNLNALLARS